MRTAVGVTLAMAVTAGAPAALAGDFDGSSPLICAAVQAMDCVVGEECVRGLAADIGAPTFMRIDFERKTVIGPKRSSPVHFMEASGEQLLLQGTELGFGWTIAIDQSDGSMSATLVDHGGAFVLFGACTPQ
jgi:hypothetical protein